jgi:hypothetical protein
MTKLIDYTGMVKKIFWKEVDANGAQAKKDFLKLWDEMDERIPTQEEAVKGLNDLFLYSHLRIKEYSSVLADNYPTKQYTRNRLAKQEDLWWTDHYTAGISCWSTLNWFSAKKDYFRGSKTLRFSGASTHFVVGYHSEPFYIVPLMHGSWHEPRRNKDSFSVEMVNAGGLHRNENNKWCYWAKQLPLDLVRELPPVLLDTAYRGVQVMQPFTREQIVNNIKLKRLVIAAINDPADDNDKHLDACRMSQHSDWRRGKTDMGPIWPYEECNGAAFAPEPILELDFIQEYDKFLDEKGAIWDEDTHTWEDDNEAKNPEYGNDTPTHDDDTNDDDDIVLSTGEVQELLVKKGYTVKIDGKPGPETRNAIKLFQAEWNKKQTPKLKVDGIAGPQTCECLKK